MRVKSLLTAIVAVISLTATLPATAQQLPNNGFEDVWSTCTPWTGGYGDKTIGQNPDNWCISHVMGITSGLLAGTGKKAMGERISGYNSNSAVKVYNDETGAMGITRVVPGYVTLGTTWSTAQGTNSATHDGGTWGGISFLYRPDAVSFYFQRGYSNSNKDEKASFIGYLWRGSWSQSDVPVTITSSGAAKKTTMSNRDRNVLGLTHPTGGTVSPSSDAELIAKVIFTEAVETSSWTAKLIEFEYYSSSSPTMINLIFSANDYFNTASATKGNSLCIDDVKLIYYSKLADLKYKGATLSGFSKDVFNYNIDEYIPETIDGLIETTLYGQGKSATVTTTPDFANDRIIVKVTGVDADENGEKEHSYTLQFKARPKALLTGLTINGQNITVGSGSVIATRLPYNSATQISAIANADEGSTVSISDMTVNNGIPEVKVTVHNDDAVVKDVEYTLQFLPFEQAKLATLTINGTPFSGTISDIIETKLPYTDGITIAGTATTTGSGNPTVSVSEMTLDGNVPTVKVSAINSPAETHDYTLRFLPAKAELIGVTIGSETKDFNAGTAKFDMALPADKNLLKPIVQTADISGEVVVRDIAQEGNKYKIVAGNSLSETIAQDYYVEFWSYDVTITEVKMNGKVVTVNGFGSDNWIINEPRPNDKTGFEFEFAQASGNPQWTVGELTAGDPNVQVTFTNGDYIAPRTVNITFLDYIAELGSVTLANNKTIVFSGEAADAGVRYSDGVKPISGKTKPSSGNPQVTFSEITDPDNPQITITVTNSDAVPAVSKTYTLSYSAPFSSRISGVTVRGTTYNVDADGKTIDLSAADLPMPAANEIQPVYILPDPAHQSAEIKIDTEKGTGTLTVTNSQGNDHDGLRQHEYVIKFAPVSISRPKNIIVAGSELEPAFSSKTYEYHVKGYMPENNDISFEWFGNELQTAFTREGDAYSESPKIIVTVTNPASGKDFDGEESHTYTLTFNQRHHEFRSTSLGDIKINGATIAGFESGKTRYSINTPIADESAISYDILVYENHTSDGTTVTVTSDKNKATIILTVHNDIPDEKGIATRVYTLQFLPYYSRISSISAPDGSTVETMDRTGAEISVSVPGQMPKTPEEVAALLSFPAPTAGEIKKEVSINPDAAKAIVRVSNAEADIDGIAERTYTLKFDNPYFSRLIAITVNDKDVADFDRNTYTYRVNEQLPINPTIIVAYIPGGNNNGKVTIDKQFDQEAALITVTISNTQPDVDGLSSHTYTVQYDLPYFSRLESLSVDRVPIDGLTHNGATFTVAHQLPSDEGAVKALFDYTFKSGSGTPSVDFRIDRTNALVTLTVTNGGNTDIDGKTSHIYNIKFAKPYLALLRAARVNGVLISGFSSEKTDYTLSGQMPDASRFTFDALTDCSGTPVVSKPTADIEAATISVTVSNDGDGNEEYACETTYTFRYDLPFFSQLDHLMIGGKELPLNHEGTPIAFGGQMPSRDVEFEARSKRGSGTPNVDGPVIDENNYTWTFIVTNSGGNDPLLGGNRRTYIIQFDAPYFSTAASIKVNGTDVPGFNPTVKEYTLSGQMPAEDAVEVTGTAGGSGTVSIAKSSDAESATITVTVSNPGDSEGNYASSTVYVLHFDLPYFSRLEGVSVKGTPVAGFDKNVFEYTIAGPMPAASEIIATPMKAGGTPNVRISTDSKTGIVTITVTNGGRADLDGKTEHVYTLHFDAPVNSRLASISIAGTPLAGFDPDTYSYNLTDMTMPAEGEVTATAGSDKATVTVSYNTENSTVTIKVSATAPDEDGLSEHTYTLRFKKDEPVGPTGSKATYDGTLKIFMGGEDMTGGGQAAKVEIITNEDGTCTFRLPDFSLVLEPGQPAAELGDIVVNNVSVVKGADGTETYSGTVADMELLGGEIIADVKLNGTVDAEGNAVMNIEVLWKPGGDDKIQIDVEFNGKRGEPDTPDVPEEKWSDYDGTLSIEMGGSYIAENQPATVFITEATDGKCTFKLPDFSLDMEGTVLNLGDIVVENVTVTAAADGSTQYSGFVSAMSFLGGEIIADINLSGTVDAYGTAQMTIQVLWKQDGGEDIPINVEFNGKRNEIAWISYPGKLTIALEGYDITEGGKDATVKIARTGDEGQYSFLLPDFSIALDAASEPAMIGDIQVDGLTLTPMDGFDRYTGMTEKMSLAQGDIVADVKIDGTIGTTGDVRVNVDVVWIMDDGRRVPILVKFTNIDEKPATPVRIAYTGVLKTTASDGSGERDHEVTVYLSPSYGNRADMTIEGINFPAASRAAAIGSRVTVPGVALTTMANGMTSYDGAVSGIKYRDDMTLDITLHGFSDADNRFNLLLDINWLEAGLRLTGNFDGAEDTSAIDRIDGTENDTTGTAAEYYDLRGVRVNPDNLRPGIYIRRCGNKTEKILIK